MKVALPLIACLLSLPAQTPKPASKAAPKPPATAPAPPQAPAAPADPNAPQPILNACEYIEPADASALLGTDTSASTAPSKGALLSCGYTSPNGNSLTVSIADYGIPSIAQ